MISLLLCSFLSTAQAVPMQLSQQGRLVDSSGVAAAGNHNLTFRLYNASTGGTLLWNETVSTNFTNGYYSVVLGSDTINNPLEDSVLESGDLFIEIEIDSDGPLTPRSAVTSTPFARVAGKAQSADWGGLTSIPSDIDDGDDDTVGALSCSVGEQPVYNGSGVWECGNPVDDVDADNRLSALETLVTNLQSDLATANSSISTLEGELATTQSDLATANATIATLQGSVGDNSTDIGTLDASMTDAQADIADLQTDLTAAEANIATLQTDVSGISDNVLDMISVDTTWNIGSNGNYTDLADAMAAARSVRIHPDATLTLQLANDIYTVADTINLNHPDGANIVIQGSSSDPALVQLEFAASDGFYISKGHVFGGINDLTVRGTSSYQGLLMVDESLAHMSTVVFEEWDNAIRGSGGTNLYLEGDCYFQNNYRGVYLDYNATIRHDPSNGTLYAQNNAQQGVLLYYGSSGMLHESDFSNNGNSGLMIYMSSSVYAPSSVSSFNSHNGVNVGWSSSTNVSSGTYSSNGHSGVVSHAGGTAAIGNATANSNNHGFRAQNHGFFYGDYMTASSNNQGFLIDRLSHGRTAYSTISNNTTGIVTNAMSFTATHLESFSGNGTNKTVSSDSVEQ